jgi:capsular polysaccharide biosynthesis protein
VVLAVIAGVAAGYVSAPRTPVYTARARIYVGQQSFDTGSNQQRPSNDLFQGLQSIIQTYTQMVDSREIAADALQLAPGVQRSVAGVVGATSAAQVQGTLLMDVRVSDVDPGVAQQLANAVTDAFVAKVKAINPGTPQEPGQPPRAPVSIFERAQLPGAPAPTDLTRRMILGGIFGFLAAAAAAFVLDYLDISIKTVSDAERRLELPVLGVIPMERQVPFTSTRASTVQTN